MNKYNIIKTVNFLLYTVLLVSSFLEIIFFPQIENIYGIIITFFSFLIFKWFVFKRNIILNRPFSFLAIFGLFLFMYLPIVATLLDGNPISFGLIQPIRTFSLQFIYFIITIIAFKTSQNFSLRHRSINMFFKKIGYFSVPQNYHIWILSVIGVLAKFYLLANQYGDEMTSGAGTVSIISYFAYTPICLLFPNLYGNFDYKNKKIIYLYMFFLILLAIASNSRGQIVIVLGTIFLLFCLNFISSNTEIYKKHIVRCLKVLFIAIILFPIFADMALVMVLVRNERYGITASELFDKTIDLYMDKDKLVKLKEVINRDERNSSLENMRTEWNEYYVTNIFLQRLCNYRVVDATIYHAENVGFNNTKMLNDMVDKLSITFPTPIMRAFGNNMQKEDYQYSAMDLLLSLSTNTYNRKSFIVGGDVGLGLAYFGYFFFIIQYLTYFVIFFLIEQVTKIKNANNKYPVLSLIYIFSFFNVFQVANGILDKFQYIIWGFWYNIFLLLIIYLFVIKCIKPREG